MEAVERSEGVDLQAQIGRQVPRELGRADRRGRQVHRRAELEARRAGRIGAVLSEVPRSHRDAGQAHDRDVLQGAGVGSAVALQPVRRLSEPDVEEVPGNGGRGEGRAPSDRHRALSTRGRPAGRLPSLRGGAEPLAQDAGVQGVGDPAYSRSRDPHGRDARGRDRYRPGVRRLPGSGAEGRDSVCTKCRTPPATG